MVDLTRGLAGPYTSQILAGMGARVITIEQPVASGGVSADRGGPYFGRDGVSLAKKHEDDVPIGRAIRYRGKLTVTLDLKRPSGLRVFTDLIRTADIFLENFSGGTAERMGIGYSYARSVNPRIIYCSVSGFGQELEVAGKGAVDNVVQGLSGMMLASGDEGDPPLRTGWPIADTMVPLWACIAILAALDMRSRTGRGQYIDVAMLGVLVSHLAVEPIDVLERLGVPARSGPTVPRLAPFGVYRTRDGHVVICPGGRASALYSAMGRPDLETDPRFTGAARIQNYKALDAAIEGWTTSLSTDDVIVRLDALSVPCGRVLTPGEALRDPLTRRRGDTSPLVHPRYGTVGDVLGPGVPAHFSEATADFDLPISDQGEFNDHVYRDILGYSDAEIARLREEGTI